MSETCDGRRTCFRTMGRISHGPSATRRAYEAITAGGPEGCGCSGKLVSLILRLLLCKVMICCLGKPLLVLMECVPRFHHKVPATTRMPEMKYLASETLHSNPSCSCVASFLYPEYRERAIGQIDIPAASICQAIASALTRSESLADPLYVLSNSTFQSRLVSASTESFSPTITFSGVLPPLGP